MDEVGHLISTFKEENTKSLDNVDFSRKVRIIMELEGVDDDRVLPFFLETVMNEDEYDLARIEILKILEIRESNDKDEHQKIGHIVKNILMNDPDDDVRNYAAMTVSNFMDVEGVIEQIVKIIFNVEEDINLRWNAFTAVEKMGPTQQSLEILQKCLSEDEFKKSVLLILNRWNIKVD